MRKFSRNDQVVDSLGRPTQLLQIFSEDVGREISQLSVVSGSGSPEGVVPAGVGKFYINASGGTGTMLYAKKLSDIGGDSSKGWVLV